MKDIVLFDLDGTLADLTHRLHHIQKDPKDWGAFFAACDQDKPIQHIIDIFNDLSSNHDNSMWIVSGRSDECRKETEKWILENIFDWPDKIIMRKAGDHRPDHIVKEEWLNDGTIPKDRVICVFDDRSEVVKMWRRNGIPCMQVAEGDF